MANSKYETVERYSTTNADEKSSNAPFSVEAGYPTIRFMGSHIRERIKAARQHAKLTQEKLGELVGVSKSAVSMWETTNSKKYTTPTIENLKLISAFTGAPVEWLMDDDATISDSWRRPTEVIQFPGNAIEEAHRFGDVAIECAKIIDQLTPEEQIEIVHYLRVRIQTKGQK